MTQGDLSRATAAMVTMGLVAAALVVGVGTGNASAAAPVEIRNVEFLGDRVNMRASPSPGAPVITQAYRGDQGSSYCQDRGTDNYTWIKVHNGTRGGEGWVRGDLARADGPLQQGGCTFSLAPRYA